MKTYSLIAHTNIAYEVISSVAVGLASAKGEAKRLLRHHPTAFEVIVIAAESKTIERTLRRMNDNLFEWIK